MSVIGRIVGMLNLPEDVIAHIRSIFAACNVRTTEKLSMNPNAPEESFDLTWIEHLSRYSATAALPSEWLVRIDAHYLGGMRHFYRWEIADIGVLVHLRLGDQDRRSKVALLQSKRLYPKGTPVRDETRVDYAIGFGRLADPEQDVLSLDFGTEFRFTDESEYEQITTQSDQVEAIDAYERDVRLRVYYQLYNPWRIPFTQRVPLAGYVGPDGEPALGVRIVPAQIVHGWLAAEGRRSPRVEDLAELGKVPAYGWRLEQFISDEMLACREGDEFESIEDDRIQTLFYRRSGAIAAAIAITIEAPGSGASAT